MRVGLALLFAVVAAVAASCASDEPQKKPPPPKCPRVNIGDDTVIEEVLCKNEDSDGDGVDDAVDLCPKHNETDNGVHDLDGCPDPDADRDQIVDFEDACPDEAGVFPDGCPINDADKDGLADHLDACPHKAEDLDGDADADGCPEGADDSAVQTRELRVEVVRGKSEPTGPGARELSVFLEEIAPDPDRVLSVTIVARARTGEVRSGSVLQLAQARGRRVKRLLVDAGVPVSRVVVDVDVSEDVKDTAVTLIVSLGETRDDADGGVTDAGFDAGPADPF